MNELDEERFRALLRRVKELELKIKELEYDHYRDDDSPKGENIPGVRFRNRIATLQL